MTDLPCDDLSCVCCHPDEQHSCRDPEFGSAGPYTCPKCGVTWTKQTGRPDHLPAAMTDPPEWWRADQPTPTVFEIAARRSP